MKTTCVLKTKIPRWYNNERIYKPHIKKFPFNTFMLKLNFFIKNDYKIHTDQDISKVLANVHHNAKYHNQIQLGMACRLQLETHIFNPKQVLIMKTQQHIWLVDSAYKM